MKRTFYCFSIAILILGVAKSFLFSQTAEEIVTKMIKAHGGKIALESVKDWIKSGSIEAFLLKQSGSLTEYKKEPNKRRTDMKIGDRVITRAYDGENAWWINPQTGNPEKLPASQGNTLAKQGTVIHQFFVTTYHIYVNTSVCLFKSRSILAINILAVLNEAIRCAG